MPFRCYKQHMVEILNPTDDALIFLQSHFERGGIAAIPTETVYGLGGDATNPDAVIAIYQAKERPQFNPLISHYASLEMMEKDVLLDERARMVAQAFWPGPLTLILPKTAASRLADITTAGLPTAAVRMPRHPVTRQLLAHLPFPLAAPSANPSGRLSPTAAEHVAAMMGERIPYILDGGACEQGVESTILDVSGRQPALLRYGTISVDTLEAVVGPVLLPDDKHQPDAPKAPGMLLRHYAPSTPLRLSIESPHSGEALLGFGDTSKYSIYFGFEMNLSPSGDLVEASRNLFAYLHQLDARKPASIAVSPIPNHGLGIALNDRLKRAAEKEG